MPIYEYQCIACEHTFESIQPLAVDSVVCPMCEHINNHARTAMKKMSVGSFRINGHSAANGYNYSGGGTVYNS